VFYQKLGQREGRERAIEMPTWWASSRPNGGWMTTPPHRVARRRCGRNGSGGYGRWWASVPTTPPATPTSSLAGGQAGADRAAGRCTQPHQPAVGLPPLHLLPLGRGHVPRKGAAPHRPGGGHHAACHVVTPERLAWGRCPRPRRRPAGWSGRAAGPGGSPGVVADGMMVKAPRRRVDIALPVEGPAAQRLFTW